MDNGDVLKAADSMNDDAEIKPTERRVAWQKLSESARHNLGLPKAPARPRAAFLFFSADVIESVRAELDGQPAVQIQRRVSERWRASTLEERAPFEAQTAAARVEYGTSLASYRTLLDANFDRIKAYELEHGGEASFVEPPASPPPGGASSSSSPSASNNEQLPNIPCTACDTGTLGKVGAKRPSKKRRVHPLLEVPVCSSCLAVYESGEFTLSEIEEPEGGGGEGATGVGVTASNSDRHEIYCRWCGDGGDLVYCDSVGCPCSFCTTCIARNFGLEEAGRVQTLPEWTCFVCAPDTLKPVKDKYRELLGPPTPGTNGSARKRPRDSAGVASPDNASGGAKSPTGSLFDGEGGGAAAAPAAAAAVAVAPAAARGGDGKSWVVSEDISLGRERNIQLRCVNEVDGEVPPSFTYTASNVDSSSVCGTLCSRKDPDFLVCCDCTDGCVDPNTCACIRLSNGVGGSLASSGGAGGQSAAGATAGAGAGGGGGKDGESDTGGRLPTASYSQTTGRLMEPRLAVYECGPACRCRGGQRTKAGCFNRVVGNGPVLPLEVFRCLPVEKGWGVRCLEDIPAGTFIACYQGELLDEAAVEQRGTSRGDEYLFNLDLYALDAVELAHQRAGLKVKHTVAGSKTATQQARETLLKLKQDRQAQQQQQAKDALAKIEGGVSGGGNVEGQASSSAAAAAGLVSQTTTSEEKDAISNQIWDEVEGSGYLIGIDAKWWGNVGRFFNHSCAPNMEKQSVFVESHDLRVPSLAFFTNSDVAAGTELVYNYGYVKGSVEGKEMICRCGEPGCVTRMY